MDDPPASAPAGKLRATAAVFVPSLSATFQLHGGALEFVPKDSFQRELYGGVVTFGPGASVLSVKLPSDSSTIQIFGLTIRDLAEAKRCEDEEAFVVLKVLDNLGVRGVDSTIHIQKLERGDFVATVTFVNPDTGKLAAERWRNLKSRSVVIKEILPTAKVGERIDMTAIKCTWAKTGKYAFVQYKINADPPPRLDDFVESISKVTTASGRRLKCTATTDPKTIKYDQARKLKSFQIRNLDEDADEAVVTKMLVSEGFFAPSKIKIRDIDKNWNVNDGVRVALVREAFEKVGAIESFNTRDAKDGSKMIAHVAFYDPEDARKAVVQLHSKLLKDFPVQNRLRVERCVSIKFNVPNRIAEALRSRLVSLRSDLKKDGQDRLKITDSGGTRPFVTLRFSDVGEHAISAAAEAKAIIEKLLAGTVITESSVPLWHPWFATSPALSYLVGLSRQYQVYIRGSKSQLVLYGGKFKDRHDVCQVLKAKCRDLSTHIIKPVGKMGMAKLLEKLKTEFGGNLVLNLTSGPPQVLLRGSLADFQKASRILSPITPDAGDCAICYTDPGTDDAIRLGCGHIYCSEDFTRQAKNADAQYFPLKCAALNSECPHIFTIKELKNGLSTTEFETLAKLSFDTYIRTHPREYAFCPYPDCETVFRPVRAADDNEPTQSITCTGCLSSICASCKSIHPGMTCAHYRDVMDGTDAFNLYSANHEVKRCPNPACGLPCEKVIGCNHMICRCGIHFCWVCLMVFPDMGQTYRHLDDMHGGNGLQPAGVEVNNYHVGQGVFQQQIEFFDAPMVFRRPLAAPDAPGADIGPLELPAPAEDPDIDEVRAARLARFE